MAIVLPCDPPRRRSIRIDAQADPALARGVDQRVLDRADDLTLARREALDVASLDGDAVAIAPEHARIVAKIGDELVVERLEPLGARAIDVPQHARRRAQIRHRRPRELAIEWIHELAEALLARLRRALADRALGDADQLGVHHDVGLTRADQAKLVDDHECGPPQFKVASKPTSAKNRFLRYSARWSVPAGPLGR